MQITDLIAFLSGQDLMIVGVIILVLFGGAKIPQLMRGLGRGMGEFKAGLEEGKDAMNRSMHDMDDDWSKASEAKSVEAQTLPKEETSGKDEPATKS